MPQYQTFLTPERQEALFEYIRYLLFYISPGVMISVAILTVAGVIWLLVYIFDEAKKKNNKNNDDDDDVEVYRY